MSRRIAWLPFAAFAPARFFSRIGATGLLMTAFAASAANWPQYRGVRAGGVDDSAALPVKWNIGTGENVRWVTPIPGLAHSAPIVWDDRVYVATAVGPGKADLKVGLYGDVDSAKDNERHEWRLLALDKATGKVIWNVVGHAGVPKVARHTKATHCNSTPATDGRHIVALFGSEGLFCFDPAGKLLWKKDLGPMDAGWFMSKNAQWGFASSPIIHDGKVIVQCDVQQGSFLAAFDVTTGRELWRTPRGDVPTWGTPTIVGASDRTQIAVNGWHHSGGYDFATGKELWKHDGGGDIPVPTPIVSGDLIYFTSAHGRLRPMRAVRANASGDISPTQSTPRHSAVAWEHDTKGNYMQTPIVVGSLLYASNDLGLARCFDAQTGDIRYEQRLSNRNEGFTASPVSDGRHLYFTSELGNVYVIPVGEKFSVAAANALDETCLSTPAISDGALFFRTREKVVAIATRR